MTTAEVARVLRVHRNTVDRERQDGRLACVRIGRRVFHTAEQVNKFIQEQQRTEGGAGVLRFDLGL